MEAIESKKLRLTAEEAEYIEDLIIRNNYIIRATVSSVLQEHYERLGEDCISEIYLLACEKIEVLKNHENPDGWIIVSSRNIARNLGRKYNTMINMTSDEDLTNLSYDDDVFNTALYNIWIKDGSIEKLLNILTPHEREIYELVFKQRLTSKEAAEILGVSSSTIRNTVANIKKKIINGFETNLY